MNFTKMNKATFTWILECALLSFDGVSKEKMIEFGADEKDAEAGIRLCDYLKSIKTSQEKNLR